MTDPSYKKRIGNAVESSDSLEGMRRAFRTILERQKENSARVSDLEPRKDRLRKTKQESVGNEKIFATAIASLRDNGVRVILAKTRDAALSAVADEVRGCEVVVKSKSNVSKELHLSESLGAKGIQVIETDLGDRIIQLAGCQAAHPTGPACHLTRQQISALFSEHFGRPVSDDPKDLTEVMREEIAGYLNKARVGITGANAITAQEGAIVIVHNEGNAAKCAMLPEKHIIVTTPDKVVPSIDDAINVSKLQTFLSTGKVVSSYINVITGTSYTSDIEKKVYKGMHGPKEVIVIFLDGGRLQALDKEPQYCIGCGMCLLYCPVYDIVGPVYGTCGHMGGQGVYLEGTLGRLDDSIESGLYSCTSCGACKEVCPSGIDIKSGIIRQRTIAGQKKKRIPEEHNAILASISNYENPLMTPRSRKQKWAAGLGLGKKGEVIYFAGCSTSLLHPDTAKKAVRLLRATGTEPAYLGSSERCCGSTMRKIGAEDLAKKRVDQCLRDFKDAGATTVVTSCPGCSSSLKRYDDLLKHYNIRIENLSQFLDKRSGDLKFKELKELGAVAYHDPCDLGREQGVYEEPRRLLARAVGRTIELDRSRSLSACCGSGSGVKNAYPELARKIASQRIKMAEEAGARTLATACPWCVQSLRECQGENPAIEVLDLLDILDRSLGPHAGD